jgi:hypothetical protein
MVDDRLGLRSVNPTPLKAERAWKRAASCDRPVATRATVAMRVITTAIATTSKGRSTTMTAASRLDERRPAEGDA